MTCSRDAPAAVVGVILPLSWERAICEIYTLLMAFSRTYLGAHWLTDTLGGALAGAGVALLLWAALAVPLERERVAWHGRRRAALT